MNIVHNPHAIALAAAENPSPLMSATLHDVISKRSLDTQEIMKLEKKYSNIFQMNLEAHRKPRSPPRRQSPSPDQLRHFNALDKIPTDDALPVLLPSISKERQHSRMNFPRDVSSKHSHHVGPRTSMQRSPIGRISRHNSSKKLSFIEQKEANMIQ